MIYALTILGLILIPFYDVIFRFFPNVSVIAADTRSQREMMAVIIALALGLSALYHGTKPCKNKWLLFFVFLQLVAVTLIPRIPMVINGIDNSVFWVWKPLFQVVCFLLMFIAVSGAEFTKEQITNILTIMFWCGVAMALYVIAQTAGFDQYNAVRDKSIILGTQFPERVGTLGQPTLVSAFTAMIIPIALYLRKYIFAVIMVLAVWFTHSQMALGALAIGVMLHVCLNRPKASLVIIPAFIVTSLALFFTKTITFGFSGRLAVWQNVIKEMLETKIKGYEGLDFSFFGHGLGAFPYISMAADNSNFGTAHNEYLTIFYACGIFGLSFFVMALLYFSEEIWIGYQADRRQIALICSFAVISLCAVGNFAWHLGGHQFYTIVILGLLFNQTINGGAVKCSRNF